VVASLEALLHEHRPSSGFDVETVVSVASRVDRLGYAFAVSYDAALHQLVPSAAGLLALAATENRSAHPRDITTTVSGDGRVSGEKSFVTLGQLADTLLVVARTGTPKEDGRPDLRLVSVGARAEGVVRDALPKTFFAPELPHARVALHDVAGTILPGDGYARYMKPFRTVEDVWVHLGLVAWLWGMATRDGWGEGYLAEAEATLAASRALVSEDPASPATHLALGGLIDRARSLCARVAFSEAFSAERAMFERDGPLLLVAERARTERLSRARAAIP
jgi:hypothetical protein